MNHYEIVFRSSIVNDQDPIPLITECVLFSSDTDKSICVNDNMRVVKDLDYGNQTFHLDMFIPKE